MTRPPRARISGHYAGPVSRSLAYLIDISFASTGLGLIAAFVVGLINTVFGVEIEWNLETGVFGSLAVSVGLFLYFWVGIAISGRTLGMSVIGIKVVCREGRPVSPGRAAVMVLVLPVSITTVVGVLGILFDGRQRALHDWVARTAVVYDWGDRPAELPAPLSKWLAEHGVDDGSASPIIS